MQREMAASRMVASSLFRVLATIPFNANSQEDKWRRFRPFPSAPPAFIILPAGYYTVQLSFFRRIVVAAVHK